MRFESEVVSEELLPAVRSVIAKRLSTEYGLNQQEIADLLEITQPAVSQYLNEKRARKEVVQKIKDDPQTGILLNDAADKAAKEKNYSQELKNIVSAVRDKGMMKEEFSNAERIL
jgi:predicted transcriptional regulator